LHPSGTPLEPPTDVVACGKVYCKGDFAAREHVPALAVEVSFSGVAEANTVPAYAGGGPYGAMGTPGVDEMEASKQEEIVGWDWEDGCYGFEGDVGGVNRVGGVDKVGIASGNGTEFG
jgi:hypothetical protein